MGLVFDWRPHKLLNFWKIEGYSCSISNKLFIIKSLCCFDAIWISLLYYRKKLWFVKKKKKKIRSKTIQFFSNVSNMVYVGSLRINILEIFWKREDSRLDLTIEIFPSKRWGFGFEGDVCYPASMSGLMLN